MVVAEAARQIAGFSHVPEDVGDISIMFGESKTDAGPEVETKAHRQARSSIVESSESEPEERLQARLALPAPRATPIKKRTRSQTSQASKPSCVFPTEARRKKDKSASK